MRVTLEKSRKQEVEWTSPLREGPWVPQGSHTNKPPPLVISFISACTPRKSRQMEPRETSPSHRDERPLSWRPGWRLPSPAAPSLTSNANARSRFSPTGGSSRRPVRGVQPGPGHCSPPGRWPTSLWTWCCRAGSPER